MEIRFHIELDSDGSPDSICWKAEGTGNESEQPCKAVMISIWDADKKNTVRFDLWTKEMMQHDMNAFVFESLLMLADAFQQATGNTELAREIRQFGESFGIQSKVIGKPESPSSGNDVKPLHPGT